MFNNSTYTQPELFGQFYLRIALKEIIIQAENVQMQIALL